MGWGHHREARRNRRAKERDWKAKSVCLTAAAALIHQKYKFTLLLCTRLMSGFSRFSMEDQYRGIIVWDLSGSPNVCYIPFAQPAVHHEIPPHTLNAQSPVTRRNKKSNYVCIWQLWLKNQTHVPAGKKKESSAWISLTVCLSARNNKEGDPTMKERLHE
jgi:hypothetical protein